MSPSSSHLHLIDLGYQSYLPVWKLQKEIHAKREAGIIPDTLILVEHAPVYTLGKNASEANILASREFLDQEKIEVVRTDRGGEVTYHGPGQLVGYPIIDLRNFKTSASWYVHKLEDTIIQTLQDFGITSQIREGFPGVWINDTKIAAIGVRISHWITMHGFALNVTSNLNHYSGIIPCGLVNKGVASMAQYIRNIHFDQVKEVYRRRFCEVLGYTEVENIASDNLGR